MVWVQYDIWELQDDGASDTWTIGVGVKVHSGVDPEPAWRHLRKIDRFAILVYCAHGAVSLIIAETVLDTYNDPARDMSVVVAAGNSAAGYARQGKHTKGW